MISRSTDIKAALRSRQRGFLLNPFRFGGGGGGGGGDPYWYNVEFLLRMNGTDGDTTFLDSGPNSRTFTRVGSPTISNVTTKFGGGSGSFLRSGTIKSTQSSYAPGTGDFTLEGWVWWLTASGSSQWGIMQAFTDTGNLSTSNATLAVFANTGSVWGLYVSGVANTGYAITTGTWHSWCFCRSGGTMRFFVNGVMRYESANTANFSGTTVNFGGYYSSTYDGDCYLDEIRYTKGIARYTANYTPATSEFPTA